MKKTYTIIILLIGVGIVGLLAWQYAFKPISVQTVTNFEECAEVVGVVMESYPRKCKAPDGTIFTEIISKETTPPPTQLEKITNFEQCAKAGGQVMQSYPKQCRSSEGKIFTEFTQ